MVRMGVERRTGEENGGEKTEEQFIVINLRITVCTAFSCFASVLLPDSQADYSIGKNSQIKSGSFIFYFSVFIDFY